MGELTFQNNLTNTLCETNSLVVAGGEARNLIRAARNEHSLEEPCQVRGHVAPNLRSRRVRSALEATQGQMGGFFRQLPCRHHLEEVTSV